MEDRKHNIARREFTRNPTCHRHTCLLRLLSSNVNDLSRIVECRICECLSTNLVTILNAITLHTITVLHLPNKMLCMYVIHYL